MASEWFSPPAPALDSNGSPFSGATWTFYISGTTTPQAVYSDADLNTSLGNVVPADAAGRPENNIYFDADLVYRGVCKSASGAVTLFDIDPINNTILNGLLASDGSSKVGFIQSGTAPVARTLEGKAREVKSFEDWFAAGKTWATMTTAETFTALQKAVTSALANGHDLYHPGGTYNIGQNYFPLRDPNINPASLIDCGGLTIYGAGPQSVFKNEAQVDGFDVFQLNALANLNLRDFAITTNPFPGVATNGSNGISITGGYDHITIANVFVYDMPSIDLTANIDGGAGLTIQCDGAVATVGRIKVTNFRAKNCSYAFSFQTDADAFLTKPIAADVDVYADGCFAAVQIGGGGASAAVPEGTHTGIKVRAQALNCQKGVQLTRAHGVQVDCQIITTVSAETRRQNADGDVWYAADGSVEGLFCAYAKNSQVSVTGNLGECDFKARIGGASAGSSGLNGATEHCNIFLDIGGIAGTLDVASIDFGGNAMNKSVLSCTETTATSLPDDFYLASRRNDVEPSALNIGSFTGTLTGVSGTVTGTVTWSLIDDVAVLEIPGLTGTSDATTATITGIPVFLRPTTAQGAQATVVDNGTAALGRAVVETSGAITLYVGAATAFTGSGTKGVQFSTISYRRS